MFAISAIALNRRGVSFRFAYTVLVLFQIGGSLTYLSADVTPNGWWLLNIAQFLNGANFAVLARHSPNPGPAYNPNPDLNWRAYIVSECSGMMQTKGQTHNSMASSVGYILGAPATLKPPSWPCSNHNHPPRGHYRASVRSID